MIILSYIHSLIHETTRCVCSHPTNPNSPNSSNTTPKTAEIKHHHADKTEAGTVSLLLPPTRSELLGGGADVPLVTSLLGQQSRVDVGHHAAGRDRHSAQQLAQLLVVSHRQLDVARHDPVLLVVPSSVPGQLQHLRKPTKQSIHNGDSNSEIGPAQIWKTGREEEGSSDYLGGEVLEDGGEVHGGPGADALRVLAGLEVPRDAPDGELQPSLGGPRHRLGRWLRLPAAAASCGTHRRFAFGGLETSELFEVGGATENEGLLVEGAGGACDFIVLGF